MVASTPTRQRRSPTWMRNHGYTPKPAPSREPASQQVREANERERAMRSAPVAPRPAFSLWADPNA